MRAQIAQRLRSASLSAVPPPRTSSEYSSTLAKVSAGILYRSPISSKEGLPIFVLNAAALPDAHEVDFDALLPYVLARLPGEEELISGANYEVIFFAAGGGDGATAPRKHRPGWGWFLQAYHVLSRAMRKRLQKLYIVHERSWVRILVEMFSTIVSPKFRRKIIHVSTLSNLALYLPIENLLIPPSAYLHDRRLSPDIFSPYVSGRRAFTVRDPLPRDSQGNSRLPRVLRETTNFILIEANVKTEGIFRVPPHAKLREVLREAYDRGQKFIIWKDYQATLPPPPYREAEGMDEIIEEIDQRDAYGVHMASGLLKMWYAELLQPVFPHSIYGDLRAKFGDPRERPNLPALTELISPRSQWSCLPSISREILTRHLLPLLSLIAAYEEYNKMTAENLAVCFAPALLCGPDQLEDAKVSSIIRRIIMSAIELWSNGLREACSVGAAAFKRDLVLPPHPEDWEDPLEDDRKKPPQPPAASDPVDAEKHFTGIIMQDNEARDRKPPPLPPRLPLRPASSGGVPGAERPRTSGDSVRTPRRKPAPPLMVPPRYSAVVDGDDIVDESPIRYAAIADGFGPPQTPDASSSFDEKKPGTEDVGISPTVHLPKHTALTAEQVRSTEKPLDARNVPQHGAEGRMPLPGLVNPKGLEIPKRTLVHSANEAHVPEPLTTPPKIEDSPVSKLTPTRRVSVDSGQTQIRRPSWPASSRQVSTPLSQSPTGSPNSSSRGPTITSLARPVYPHPPAPTNTYRPVKVATLPTSAPKPRMPSPGILKRHASFEQSKKPSEPASGNLAPRKLDLKKASVEELRKLYEDRAGTAKTLVEVGRSQSPGGKPSPKAA